MIIIDKLTFQNAKLQKTDILKKMDTILFPNNDKSLLQMDCEEANSEIERKMKNCMKNDTVYGSLNQFAEMFAKGSVDIQRKDTINVIINKLIAQSAVIEKSLSEYGKYR
jgi:hypothetical protein